MKKLIVLCAFILPFINAQATVLKCEYTMAGAPLGTVNLTLDELGVPGPFAEVSLFFTPMKLMPVTNVTAERGELFRLYLAKDDPSSQLLMTVTPSTAESMKSMLLNAAAPAGAKELHGTCK